MKNRILSRVDMLVERSELQTDLSVAPQGIYTCPKCGIEYANPQNLKCGYCNTGLVATPPS